MLDQVLAPLGLLDLFGTFEQAIEVAIVVDELRCRLDPDAGHARHIVGAVAGERLHVDHPLRPHAEALVHLLGADLPILEVVVHHHRVAFDELHQILVGGDDGDPRTPRPRGLDISRDQVVGFEADELDRRQVEGAGGLADERELRNQLLRRLAPVRLVELVDLIAKGEPRRVEDHRGMVRIGFAQDLPQHVGEAEHRIDRRAVGAGQRRERMEGAEDEARAVDEVEVAQGARVVGGFVAHDGRSGFRVSSAGTCSRRCAPLCHAGRPPHSGRRADAANRRQPRAAPRVCP